MKRFIIILVLALSVAVHADNMRDAMKLLI